MKPVVDDTMKVVLVFPFPLKITSALPAIYYINSRSQLIGATGHVRLYPH